MHGESGACAGLATSHSVGTPRSLVMARAKGKMRLMAIISAVISSKTDARQDCDSPCSGFALGRNAPSEATQGVRLKVSDRKHFMHTCDRREKPLHRKAAHRRQAEQ